MARLQRLWRLLWSIPAVLMFAGSGPQLVEHRAVLARIARSSIPRDRVPPATYSEHPTMGLVLGLIFRVLAFRRRNAA